MSAITCIYCKQQRPSSDEHVLQRSLGGNLTTPDVCKKCNNGFSDIDQALADRSIVSFTRLSDTPQCAFPVKLGSRTTCTDAEGNVIELGVANEYQIITLPQVLLNRNGTVAYTACDENGLARLVEYVDRLLAANVLGSIRTVADPETPSAAFVLHREKEGYLRVPDLRDRDLYVQVLKDCWAQLRARMVTPNQAQSVGRPEVKIRLVYDPNKVYRAIAKSAFNTLAVSRGTALVMRPELDAIREYILGNVQLPTSLAPDTIAVDQRFVKEVAPENQVFAFGQPHTIVFHYQRPHLIAFVNLYESHQFVVSFPPMEYEERETLFGHEFSVDRTRNHPLTEIELYTLLLAARPGFLGPDMEIVRRILAETRTEEDAPSNGTSSSQS